MTFFLTLAVAQAVERSASDQRVSGSTCLRCDLHCDAISGIMEVTLCTSKCSGGSRRESGVCVLLRICEEFQKLSFLIGVVERDFSLTECAPQTGDCPGTFMKLVKVEETTNDGLHLLLHHYPLQPTVEGRTPALL